MADDPTQPLPDWIAEFLNHLVPPEDYDARVITVIDGHLADRAKPISRPKNLR
nr:hypothetical protein OG781_22715 [Streptomyces sp. NBC_00830]